MNNQPGKSEPQGGGNIKRQTFIRVAAGAVGLCYAAAMGYPVYRYLESPIEKEQEAKPVNEVSPPDAKKLPEGSALIFKFGSRPAILIHHKDGSWVALSAVCKHLGCTVQYEADKDRIFCACHGGVYNAYTGANVSGPPPSPLDRFGVKVTENSVIVTRTPSPA
jgi:cytochrome b6-f complex iron-sulfur subunit